MMPLVNPKNKMKFATNEENIPPQRPPRSKKKKARGEGNLVKLLRGPSKRPNKNRPSWEEENKENIPPPPLTESPFTLNVSKPDVAPKRYSYHIIYNFCFIKIYIYLFL